MIDKELLAKSIREVEKTLKKKRLTYNTGIWLGYSVIIGFMLYAFMLYAKVDNPSLYDAFWCILLALIFGGICWFVNVCVWAPSCWSIFETVQLKEELIKQFNEASKKGEAYKNE